MCLPIVVLNALRMYNRFSKKNIKVGEWKIIVMEILSPLSFQATDHHELKFSLW